MSRLRKILLAMVCLAVIAVPQIGFSQPVEYLTGIEPEYYTQASELSIKELMTATQEELAQTALEEDVTDVIARFFEILNLIKEGKIQEIKGSSCDQYACNCVYFARCMVPGLPTGLTTIESKKRIKNTDTAKAGRVAIMTVGSYGHLGVVTKVEEKKVNKKKVQIISIIEANYVSCKVTKRSGTESDLKIYGYWK